MAVILSKQSCLYLIFLIFYITSAVYGQESSHTSTEARSPPVRILSSNQPYQKTDNEVFVIYCFKNVPKSIFQIWRSVQLVLLTKPFNYEVFPGMNETEVSLNYESKSMWKPSFLFASSDSVIDIPAFSEYCVGISSKEKYSLQLQVRIINYWKVLRTVLGIFIFLCAPALSRNSFFHYTSGVSVGVLASILVLLYILSRFIPKKSASYAVLVFGYSFFLYILNVFGHHFHEIVTQYTDYVICYCFVTAFLSFIVCYRLGPVKNERTCDIIQWSMQAFSLLLIFFSSEYREISMAIILLLFTGRMIPSSWIKRVQFVWYRCFPPKVKLLTELEYIEQGNIETKKALESLRKYCSSPDCDVWRVIRSVKDPLRFANFIETGSHYTDQELLAYNSEDFDDYGDASDS